jgi:manganese-dependent ADP-ribose/CDP-alcohol diphosphatase
MRMLFALISAIIISFSMPDKNGSEIKSAPKQEQKPLFTFGVITDVQYCDCEPAGTRYYRSSLLKLREAVGSFIADSVAFIVDLGDLIDRDFNSYSPVMNILDSTHLKVWHATGNHDYLVDQKYKKRIPQLENHKEGYYSFSQYEFRFIVLNGNDISTYGTGNKKAVEEAQNLIMKIRADGEPNAIDWNGGLGEKQMLWFKSQLDEAAGRNEKVIILCHFPVWPQNQHNLLNYREVLTILEKYNNIIAWFSGHNHAGNYGNFNLIHFVTLRGMVETEANTSFAEVEIYRNKIWIKGSGREKSQILAL